MWRIVPPQNNVKESIAACLSGCNDAAFVARLGLALAILNSDEVQYLALGSTSSLYMMNPGNAAGGAHCGDFRRLYSRQMICGPGRSIYDQIIIGARTRGRNCPYCNSSPVDELDHFLPKSKFSRLSVTPYNLVPICHRCNSKKRAFFGRTAVDQVFHPYFEDAQQFQWLKASVNIDNDVVSLRYTIETPAEMSTSLRTRIVNQVEKLDLLEKYAILASCELSDLSQFLRSSFDQAGEVGVSSALSMLSLSHQGTNSWKRAMYIALGSSTWFCQTGVTFLKVY